MKKVKYNNKKVTINGITLDSKDEARYYEFLLNQQNQGLLRFSCHPKYELIPKFTDAFGVKHRATTYTPDFYILYCDGSELLVDIKGFGTQQGDLRRKLFLHKYPNLPLVWLSRNLKHGDKDGWIEYDELKKIQKQNKKEKKTI